MNTSTSMATQDANPVAPGTLAAVRAIRPTLMENRLWADDHAGMAPAVLDATRTAGVYMLFTPREYGGSETPYPESVAIFEELGYGDPTVAWHAGNSAAAGTMSRSLPSDVAAAVFDGNRGPFGFSVVAAGRAVPVEGGYRLSGEWPFVTGSEHMSWAVLFGSVQRDEEGSGVPPDVRSFYVPARDIIIRRTWGAASAMRGTGSHAVTVADVFVPAPLAVPLTDRGTIDRPLYRLPAGAGMPLNASMCIGITRRALDDVTRLVAAKVSRADGIAYRERPAMQRTLGAARAEVDIMSAGMAAAAGEFWACAEERRVPVLVRGRMWATCMWVVDHSRLLLSDLLTLSTSAVYSERNPIEMALRDVHAIAAAMEVNRHRQEDYGRVLLGMPPANPGF